MQIGFLITFRICHGMGRSGRRWLLLAMENASSVRLRGRGLSGRRWQMGSRATVPSRDIPVSWPNFWNFRLFVRLRIETLVRSA